MSKSSIDLMSPEAERYRQAFKVADHPSRVRIISDLLQDKSLPKEEKKKLESMIVAGLSNYSEADWKQFKRNADQFGIFGNGPNDREARKYDKFVERAENLRFSNQTLRWFGENKDKPDYVVFLIDRTLNSKLPLAYKKVVLDKIAKGMPKYDREKSQAFSKDISNLKNGLIDNIGKQENEVLLVALSNIEDRARQAEPLKKNLEDKPAEKSAPFVSPVNNQNKPLEGIAVDLSPIKQGQYSGKSNPVVTKQTQMSVPIAVKGSQVVQPPRSKEFEEISPPRGIGAELLHKIKKNPWKTLGTALLATAFPIGTAIAGAIAVGVVAKSGYDAYANKKASQGKADSPRGMGTELLHKIRKNPWKTLGTALLATAFPIGTAIAGAIAVGVVTKSGYDAYVNKKSAITINPFGYSSNQPQPVTHKRLYEPEIVPPPTPTKYKTQSKDNSRGH